MKVFIDTTSWAIKEIVKETPVVSGNNYVDTIRVLYNTNPNDADSINFYPTINVLKPNNRKVGALNFDTASPSYPLTYEDDDGNTWYYYDFTLSSDNGVLNTSGKFQVTITTNLYTYGTTTITGQRNCNIQFMVNEAVVNDDNNILILGDDPDDVVANMYALCQALSTAVAALSNSKADRNNTSQTIAANLLKIATIKGNTTNASIYFDDDADALYLRSPSTSQYIKIDDDGISLVGNGDFKIANWLFAASTLKAATDAPITFKSYNDDSYMKIEDDGFEWVYGDYKITFDSSYVAMYDISNNNQLMFKLENNKLTFASGYFTGDEVKSTNGSLILSDQTGNAYETLDDGDYELDVIDSTDGHNVYIYAYKGNYEIEVTGDEGTTTFSITGSGVYANDIKLIDKNYLESITINGYPLSGEIELDKSDVGLGNVDNTSDANKPISTATANALALKVAIADIVNVLTSTSTTAPLSAYQGKILADRLAILETLVGSDDTDLDTIQEIVNYIKSNKSVIDTLSSSKIAYTDIVDNLTSALANKPLSANQGVVIKALIDAIVDGTTTVGNATNATNATNDGEGNEITETYLNRTDAFASSMIEVSDYNEAAGTIQLTYNSGGVTVDYDDDTGIVTFTY